LISLEIVGSPVGALDLQPPRSPEEGIGVQKVKNGSKGCDWWKQIALPFRRQRPLEMSCLRLSLV
jgi:hypothetical protein